MFATQEKPIQVTAPLTEAQQTILTEEAARFLSKLAQAFEPRRRQLLADRRERQQAIDNGARPEFLTSTADVRNREWRVAPIPADLLDRRVEITGPVERKVVLSALHSGASVCLACF
jgi:malate synthase